jgi:hypothetical protein
MTRPRSKTKMAMTAASMALTVAPAAKNDSPSPKHKRQSEKESLEKLRAACTLAEDQAEK